MKLSEYNSELKIGDKVLLYNTFNTSMALLNFQDYEDIFINQNDTNIDLISQLYSLGFLIDDEANQLCELENIRYKNIYSNEQIINIFSTNNCNARCYYCFEKGINMIDMSDQTADDTITFILKYYTNPNLKIIWFGGEPLYNFPIIQKITQALSNRGYNLTCHITTNGSLITQEIISFLSQYYQRVSFQVTIDDIGDKYAEIKGYVDCKKEDAFKRVIDACRLIANNNIVFSVRINYLDKRIKSAEIVYHALCEIFKSFNSRPLIYLAPITLLESCQGCHNSTKHLVDLLRFNYANNIYKNVDLSSNYNLLACFNLLPKAGACRAENTKHLTITAEGKIYPCNRFASYSEYSIGHVSTGIDESTSFYKYFYNPKVVDAKCQHCNILPICQGGCKAIKLLYDKNYVCQRKEIQPELLRLYFESLNDLEHGNNTNNGAL